MTLVEPQRLLDHVWREMVRIGGGDPAAMSPTGLFRNPDNPGPGYRQEPMFSVGAPESGYELTDLLASVNRHPSPDGPPINPRSVSVAWAEKVQVSRNCAMFYAFDWYAFRHGIEDAEELGAAMEEWQLPQADLRTGPFEKGPLLSLEIACIARSFAKRMGGHCGHKGFVDGDPERDRRIVRQVVNGPVHAAPAEQRIVGCVDDCVRLQLGDIGDDYGQPPEIGNPMGGSHGDLEFHHCVVAFLFPGGLVTLGIPCGPV
jgi:hypothetical protein